MITNQTFSMIMIRDITCRTSKQSENKGNQVNNISESFLVSMETARLVSGGMNCPYGNLAKDGIIVYNGVVFVCDPNV